VTDDDIFDETLWDAYAANAVSREQRDRLARWVASHPDRAALTQAMERLHEARTVGQAIEPQWNEQRIRDAVLQALHSTPKSRPSSASRKSMAWLSGRHSGGGRRIWGWRQGAMLCLGVAALAIGFGVWSRARRKDNGKNNRADRVYHTPIAQRMTVLLADGSRVTLAPQTTLTVHGSFARGDRDVTVHGEAYFVVAPEADAPFRVHTAAGQIRVLGTQFDVRQYGDEQATYLAVMSGRVAVYARTSSSARGVSRDSIRGAIVSAGMTALIDDSVSIAAASDVSTIGAWTTGKLAFHNAPLRDVLAAIGRWYGYEFHVDDSVVAGQQLTATIDNQSSAQVLEFLKVMLDVSFTFDGPNGHVVTLHPRQTRTSDRQRDDRRLLPSRGVGR